MNDIQMLARRGRWPDGLSFCYDDARMAMDLGQRKEQFSEACLRAVAAVAGYAVAKPDVDDDSIRL